MADRRPAALRAQSRPYDIATPRGRPIAGERPRRRRRAADARQPAFADRSARAAPAPARARSCPLLHRDATAPIGERVATHAAEVSRRAPAAFQARSARRPHRTAREGAVADGPAGTSRSRFRRRSTGEAPTYIRLAQPDATSSTRQLKDAHRRVRLGPLHFATRERVHPEPVGSQTAGKSGNRPASSPSGALRVSCPASRSLRDRDRDSRADVLSEPSNVGRR